MLLSSDYIQAANDHRREDLMFEAAGQGVSFVTEMKPAAKIVIDLVEEALERQLAVVPVPPRALRAFPLL